MRILARSISLFACSESWLDFSTASRRYRHHFRRYLWLSLGPRPKLWLVSQYLSLSLLYFDNFFPGWNASDRLKVDVYMSRKGRRSVSRILTKN
ncbi:hypothetical protein AG1IA_09563 [Rhizoctonia solani AG-1 IA]|uniref:Uncharacterized protein n=1 Tax=Thanatephorus cucumeris (strain AG1-IA) TaxID=983506 RepID=L8WI60_THACA|nr:hypothetical protein AG1IA_09563 [Rhizoctonia solani AG-1 IA]